MADGKKILYVITKSVWGGAQRYVYDLATHLPREKFEIAVACGGEGLFADKIRKVGIRIIQLPELGRNIDIGRELKSLWSLIRICVRERPDIVHLSSSKAGGLGAVAARFASLVTGHRSLVVFTVHGWGFEEDRPRWQKAVIVFLSWLGALFQDKIILISEPDRRLALRFIPERKLALIRHGIAPIEFLARAEARAFFAEKIGREISPDTTVIGTIAELTKNKGLSYLIDAARQIKPKIPACAEAPAGRRNPPALGKPKARPGKPEIKIVVMGEGEEREKLQRKIHSCGLEDSVFLLGFIPEACRYLTGFDIFVLPSLKEGLPYALMEAMAAGLPAAASSVGGIPDLIINEKNGLLVPPKNPTALAEAIVFLAKNSPAAQTLGQEAQKTIARRFSVDAMTENTIRLYAAVTP